MADGSSSPKDETISTAFLYKTKYWGSKSRRSEEISRFLSIFRTQEKEMRLECNQKLTADLQIDMWKGRFKRRMKIEQDDGFFTYSSEQINSLLAVQLELAAEHRVIKASEKSSGEL